MSTPRKAWFAVAFCTSVGAHGAAYASLAAAPREPRAARLPSEVRFEVNPVPPPPTAKVASEPVLRQLPARAKASLTRAPSATPPIAPPGAVPAPSETPARALDLSGVTLTNDTGSGFAMPVGDGSTLRGLMGRSPGPRAPASAPLRTGPGAPPDALVPASDLSERPTPPGLAGLLRANYPEEARQRGLAGSASVRARIDPDGQVRTARSISETASGFGAACRRTVIGSHWSPPKDKKGRAVATEIVYTCHFEVAR